MTAGPSSGHQQVTALGHRAREAMPLIRAPVTATIIPGGSASLAALTG
jgi:hypothetical protein